MFQCYSLKSSPPLLLPLSPKVSSLHLCLLFCPACRIIRTVFLNFIWRRCGEKGSFLRFWWENKLVQPLWRTVWRFLKKLEIKLPYDPAIPLLGIHTKETRTERDICIPVFIAALFTTARTWKQPGCPLAGKWIRKLYVVHIHNGILLSCKKRMHLSQF